MTRVCCIGQPRCRPTSPQSLSSTVLFHASHIHVFHSQPSLGQALLIQCSPLPHTSTSTPTDSKGRESFHLLMDEWKVWEGLLGWEVPKPLLLGNTFVLWLLWSEPKTSVDWSCFQVWTPSFSSLCPCVGCTEQLCTQWVFYDYFLT